MNQGEYVTVPEAAEILGRSVPTVWRLIREYKLERFKRTLDRQTYLRRSDVEDLQRGTFQPREANAAA